MMKQLLAVLAITSLVACSQRDDEREADLAAAKLDIESGTTAETIPDDKGKPFDVPSDPNASYLLLKVEAGKGGNIVATTRRVGPSGTSYARREINCSTRQARYVGEGDTLADAEKPSASVGEMADNVAGSITDVSVDVACAAKIK